MKEEPLSYAVVTAARDEKENLGRLAQCLGAQSLRPSVWVIVDNGSTDGTAPLARELAERTEWIRVLSLPGAPNPERGGPVVRAFQAGLATIEPLPDVLVKVDADVSMDDDYFERLLGRFAANPSLGMASGSGHELAKGGWGPRHVTGGHVWGPCRGYRRACLSAVLPLEERTGWDGIDEVKAAVRGWQTTTFADLPFRHHRRVGTRDGRRSVHWRDQGRAAHYIGYRFSYLVMRSFFRAFRERAALAMIWGYLEAALERQARCRDESVRAYVRRGQSPLKLPARIREALGRPSA